HIFRTRKCLKNGAEQKPRFLLCELKKPGMAFFSILLLILDHDLVWTFMAHTPVARSGREAQWSKTIG
ncbi:MAG: hypothetical protein ACE5H7_16830, partial [Acidiferrobacterales bacterium]